MLGDYKRDNDDLFAQASLYHTCSQDHLRCSWRLAVAGPASPLDLLVLRALVCGSRTPAAGRATPGPMTPKAVALLFELTNGARDAI